MRCRQPSALQITPTLRTGKRCRGDHKAAVLLCLLYPVRYQRSVVAQASCIFSGSRRPQVGNAIAGQVHQRACNDLPISFKDVDFQTII